MTIRRTQSRNYNDRMEEVSRQDRSTHSISNPNKSKRVPEFMQNTLRGIMASVMANNPLPAPETDMKQSAVGNALKSKIKSTVNFIKSRRNCEICEGQIAKAKNKNLQVYMCDCEHKFNFCESCLHHYVIYKVKNFQEVMCPRDGCPASLDMDTNFFKGLPADIQKNYKKVHQFYLTSKDPDIRLCPKENCQGIIKKEDQNVMVCNECHSKFCGKCLLAVHAGDCDNEQVKFFQGNLHYRQCKKCKFIIEKNQGCNHITCKCGYQFCYVCGEKWEPVHYGNHDENGRVVPVPEPGQLQRYQRADGCCAECGCGCDCDCCQCGSLEDCCGQTCSTIIKLPLRLFFLILFLTFMIAIFVCREMIITICMFFMSILAGMTGFTCELLAELQGGWFILGIIFFPVMMVAGIVRGIREVFCDVMPELYNDFGRMFCDGLTDICN